MTETVKIGDKSRPVHFGFGALRYFEQVSGKAFSAMTETMTDTIALVWAGLKNGARIKCEEFTATVDDVADWLDQRPEAYTEILSMYGESMGNLAGPLTRASG